MLKALSQSLVSAIFPVDCEVCGHSLAFDAPFDLCRDCEATISLIPLPHCLGCGRHSEVMEHGCDMCRSENFHYDNILAACYYGIKIKKLLCAFKFERRRRLGGSKRRRRG